MLYHKVSLNKFPRIEVTQHRLSDHIATEKKSEPQHIRKPPYTWRFRNKPLNNPLIKKNHNGNKKMFLDGMK